ncbi:MAG: hypothetical protein AAF725_14280 [Acidobacteriota bacterium]
MADTSSIGPTWPPAPTSAARIKGIDTRGIIDGSSRLERLLDELQTLSKELENGPFEGCDRLSLRAVVKTDLLRRPGDALSSWVEAVLPLEGGELALVYLGRNAAGRLSDPSDLARSLDHVGRARGARPRGAEEILRRAEKAGYSLRVLASRERLGEPGIVGGMARLYRRFGWNSEETQQILENPSSLIAVAQWPGGEERRGEIVCAGVAELSHLRLEDGFELRIAEFTEAATLGEHQGRGLYSAVAALLMRELASLSRSRDFLGGEIDLGFGECSGHDLGVLIAAKRLGRRFALEFQEEHGLDFPGFLAQHVPISGAPRKTRYNDLFPTFLSRRSLYRFADA